MEITTQAAMEIVKNKSHNWLNFIAYYFIVVVLLFSGIAKIIDPLPLLETLKLITIIPDSLQIIIATLLPVVEIGLAVLMLMKISPTFTLTVVTVLFAFFLGFSVYGTVVGLGNDCGCFGNAVKSSFGYGMLGRNIIFFFLSAQLLIKNFKKM